MFPISQYRTPTTHLQIHEKNLRVDRPVFLVEKDRSSTKISLHPVFLQIVPPPHTITTISDDNDDSMSISNSQDFMDEDSRKFISDMFSQVSIEGEDDDDPISQPFSQVSLEDKDPEASTPCQVLEPAFKKACIAVAEDVLKVRSLPKL